MQNSFAALKIDTWNTQAGTKVFFVENHDLPILDININFFAGSAPGERFKADDPGARKKI